MTFRIAYCLCWFLLPGMLFGQQLSTRWNRNQCMIGEQVTLTILLKKAPADLKYVPRSGEVDCKLIAAKSKLSQEGKLEILGSFADSVYTTNGVRYWQGRYTVTAWDTGVYQFPEIGVQVGDSLYRSLPGLLEVTFEKHTVKDSLIEVPVVIDSDNWRWLRLYWWIALFPLAIIIILLIRRRNSKRIPSRSLPLKDRTLIALEALRTQAYWKKGQINEHYIEFSFILRSFLSARYELNLMERTTFETITLLRAKGVPEPTLERIRRLLLESDMVKFAMGIPDEDTVQLSMKYLEQLVVELSPLDLIE